MRRWLSCTLSVCLAILVLSGCAPGGATPPATQQAATPGPAVPSPKTTPQPSPTPPPAAATKAPAKGGELPYYQGKTIEIVVESAAGGGADTVARVTAAMLPRHIPGNPKIIVRNQPGAAGAVANNSFYEKTKPDGLTLLQNSSSPISMQMKNRDISKYDLTKYKYVGNISRASSIMLGIIP